MYELIEYASARKPSLEIFVQALAIKCYIHMWTFTILLLMRNVTYLGKFILLLSRFNYCVKLDVDFNVGLGVSFCVLYFIMKKIYLCFR